MCPQPEPPKPEKPTRENQLLTREQIPQSQSHFIPARYSDDERATLVRLAHESIDSALEEREIKLQAIPERLQEPRGAFTTLYLEGEVRGCVGYVYPVSPLFQTVIDTARSAALHDVRFLPVTKEQAARLEISISVLSQLATITPEEIELGKHGLMISLGSRRGLLLPQVPVEHGWDVITFLQQTCLKGGLPTDSWQHGASIEGFTAEVFGEHSD
jgi:AmmeMemoRadiSam system protein A